MSLSSDPWIQPFTFLTDSRAATVKFGSDAEETIWKATNVGDAFIVSVSPAASVQRLEV